MKSKLHLILMVLGSISLFLVGCAGPEAMNETPSNNATAAVPPPFIPVENEANVVIPGATVAYPIDRYVDPSDPNIMHERHVIYRMEQSPEFRLTTSADRQILIGNTVTDSPLQMQPAILSQELGAEVDGQQAQFIALNQLLEKFSSTISAANTAQNNLKSQVSALQSEVDTLNSKLAAASAQHQQQATASQQSSKGQVNGGTIPPGNTAAPQPPQNTSNTNPQPGTSQTAP